MFGIIVKNGITALKIIDMFKFNMHLQIYSVFCSATQMFVRGHKERGRKNEDYKTCLTIFSKMKNGISFKVTFLS